MRTHHRSPMNRGLVVFASLTILASGAVASTPVRRTPDACKASTQGAFRACRQEAQGVKSLTLARCENLVDPTAAKACKQQASVDGKDALASCKEQADARAAVCEKLGPAPYAPPIDPAKFVGPIDNPLFPLVPGTTFIYEGQTVDGLEHDEFAVTHNTKTILGVACVEVHDVVTVAGKLIEDTLDWFAQDAAGNVWYFGENSKQIADGLVVGVEGSWAAGIDGAQPGIIMEAHPVVGDFYRQEFLLAEAEDLAQVSSLDETVTLANQQAFMHCVKTTETSPLEPDALENKLYAPGVGNVLVIDVTTGETAELVQVISGL